MDHPAIPSRSADSHGGGMSSMGDMPGMGHGTTAAGIDYFQDGYTLTSPDRRLPAGRQVGYRFSITGPDGRTVTDFAVDQTRRMHFYAVRSDLTGFQHLHPDMAADGTWTAHVAALTPGTWRMYVSFTPAGGPGKGEDFVLRRVVTVPGAQTTAPLPPPAGSAEVDGYTVAVAGELMAGMAHPLTVTITKGGTPVTDLQPYLGTYAHLTAFHEGDGVFAHLHPQTEVDGDHGGPELSFHAELPAPGNWRLFLQFQTGGRLHTAAVTLHVA